MNMDEYQQLALRTISPKAKADPIGHAILALAGEAGELADMWKKFQYQGHDWDTRAAMLEAGDILWHLAELAYGLKVTLSEIGQANINKLADRYPDGFSEERSRNREEIYELVQAGYIAKPDARAQSDQDRETHQGGD